VSSLFATCSIALPSAYLVPTTNLAHHQSLSVQTEAMQNPRVRETLEILDTADSHQTLIRQQWKDFAAFAWNQYQDHGRGAVIIDLLQALKIGDSSKLPTYYLADGSERLLKRGGWPDSDIAGVVADYDPQEEVVFIFVRLNGECFCYNVSDELTPPMAAAPRPSN
jgi:hypothetical protein